MNRILTIVALAIVTAWYFEPIPVVMTGDDIEPIRMETRRAIAPSATAATTVYATATGTPMTTCGTTVATTSTAPITIISR